MTAIISAHGLTKRYGRTLAVDPDLAEALGFAVPARLAAPDTAALAGLDLDQLPGERVVLLALRQAMALMAQRFVLGRTLEGALARRTEYPDRARFSFDCLGEAAHTRADADRYFAAYRAAIQLLGEREEGDLSARSSVSIKLSALHPRYEYLQRRRVMTELEPRLLELVGLAERRDHFPAQLSGGEQQRVNVARGFISRQPLMLLDEPTASLDAANRRVVIEMIGEAKAAGTSFLGIFHDEEVRDAVADRIVDENPRGKPPRPVSS